jgi:hypothetical protein
MILSGQNHYTGCLPSLPPGFPSSATIRTGWRAPVPFTLFLDDSSAKDNDSMHSSMSGVLLGDEGSVNSPYFSENNDVMASLPTDNKVGKYSFYSRLSRCMEGHKIGKSNHASVEICILSKAGAFVRNMDPMKKDKKEKAFFTKYVSIIDEIEDEEFKYASVRNNMHQRYKGAKKDNNGQSLWRKYETELTNLHSFAKKIPGIGNLAKLPSGSAQLRHMKKPPVQALWTAKHPVKILLCCY